MKQNYITAKRLSLWMRLSQKWSKLYASVKETSNTFKLKKLNNLSLLLGVKHKVALASLATFVTLGAQAQISFEEITGNDKHIFQEPKVSSLSVPTFADLDGDGSLELISGNINGTINYFKKEGVFTSKTGTDNPFDSLDIGYSSAPSFVDLDADGDLDLVVGSYYGTLKYFANDANIFIEQTGLNNPFDSVQVYSYSSPEFVDLDADGDLDLVVGVYYGTLGYYTNDNNTFTKQTGTNNPFGYSSDETLRPAFIDADGDGDLDLVVGDYNGALTYFSNTNAVFTEQTGVNNPFDGIDVGSFSAPRFEDIDLDGDKDLIIGNGTGTFNYFINNGGVFTEDVSTNNPFVGLDLGTFTSPVFEDVDLDGNLDLVVGQSDGKIKYFASNGTSFNKVDETLDPFSTLNAGRKFSKPVFEDLDGDNDRDLICGVENNKLRYFSNDNQVFTEESKEDNPFENNFGLPRGYRASPAFVDVDGDGDLDLINGVNSGLSFRENTFPTFTVEFNDTLVSDINVGMYATPIFIDLDLDGDQDLVSGNKEGTITYFTNDNFEFTEQTGSDNPFDGIDVGEYSSPVFTDIDGDGDQDLFIGSKKGSIVEYRNNRIIINGLFDFNNSKALNIYPNPATSTVNTEEGQLDILDLTGNLVLSTESTGIVDVSSLVPGIYLVSQNGKRTKLIVE